MTNAKAMDLWIRLVGEWCHCYPDENGNMPCDNGVLCDSCVYDEDLKKAWHAAIEADSIK